MRRRPVLRCFANRARWGLVVAVGVAAACVVPAPAGSTIQPTIIHAAELVAPGIDFGDLLGISVAIDGNTLVVGARRNYNGGVHVFERGPTGLWGWVAELRPPTSDPQESFGAAVAVHGDTIVAGAPGRDVGATNAGAVHVFVRDPGTGDWEFDRTLGGGLVADTRYGSSVAVDDTWVVAGAPRADGDTGRVRVWRRPTWAPQTLPVFNIDTGANLGWSVAIDGSLIVAGAPYDDNGGLNRGSVHVYFLGTDGQTWGYRQQIVAPAEKDRDYFGYSVAIDGPNLVAGAPGRDRDGVNRGSVYHFQAAGTGWQPGRELTAATGSDGDGLGWSVAVEGDEAYAGVPFDSSGICSQTGEPLPPTAGSVTVFDLTSGSWVAELTNPFAVAGDQLGSSVAVDGGVVATGAPYRHAESGTVHLFADLPESLRCGGWAVTLVGTPGDDVLTGTLGPLYSYRDVIRGYGGNDTISGGDGDDVICGDDGDDLILGERGDDVLYGGDGNDRLRGATGNDRLYGGAGSDRLLPDTGNDVVDGGPGSDILDFLSGRGPIQVGLCAGTVTYFHPAHTWAHSLFSIEKVDGTRYDDILVGDPGRNVLRGKQGADQISGGGGDDDLIGGTGNDTVLGGDGDDLIKGQADDDLLEGETGADRIRGGNGDDTLRGGPGNDTLIGGLFSHRGVFTNHIDGGNGIDTCRWWFDNPINCP